jgi:hypothetical protein
LMVLILSSIDLIGFSEGFDPNNNFLKTDFIALIDFAK